MRWVAVRQDRGVPATHRATIGSQQVELPIVPVSPDLSIALFMTIDHGVHLIDVAGAELADLFRDAAPEIVVAPATLGIPVAIAVTRALGLDDHLILQKSRKVHLGDALTEEVHAITSEARSVLRLDRARLPAVAGRRALLVDDVISTGSSIAAALRLLERADAEVVGVGALLAEGDGWPEALEPYEDRLRALGRIPLFPRARPPFRSS
jgi:adenine/guanine phosphoribosyltransferase-like PRPP-binding protein